MSLALAVFNARLVPRPLNNRAALLEQELTTTKLRLQLSEQNNTELRAQVEKLKAELIIELQSPSIRRIAKVVCDYYGITYIDLNGQRRTKQCAKARHVAFYLARSLTGMSFMQVGKLIGGRDHTTVMHGFERIEEQRKADGAMNDEISELERTLKTM